jgi:hypothetical protein
MLIGWWYWLLRVSIPCHAPFFTVGPVYGRSVWQQPLAGGTLQAIEAVDTMVGSV